MVFASKIENCYVKLINSLDDDLTADAKNACIQLLKGEALHVFLNGLNSNISLIVRSQKPKDLEEAISYALNEEQQQKSKFENQKYQNLTYQNAKHCDFCNKSGHTSYNCRHRQNKQSHKQVYTTQYQPNTNFDPKTTNHTLNQHQQSNSFTNHHSNQQSNKNPNNKPHFQKFCRYCKKPNHDISECRKRQFNNEKKQQQQQPQISTISGNTDAFLDPTPSTSQTTLTPINSIRAKLQ